MRAATFLVVASTLVAPATWAEVRIVVQGDGTRTVTNDGVSGSSSRRLVKVAPPAGLTELIRRHAASASLDHRLVEAVIQVESGYNARAMSRKGARGLMQLMPATARDLGVSDVFDPDQNVGGGTRYLRSMLDSFGRLELALAAYNAGPTAVQRYGGVPPYAETRDYVSKVMRLFRGDSGSSIVVASFPASFGAAQAVVPASLRSETPRRAPTPRPVVVRRDSNRQLIPTSGRTR